MDNDSTVSGKTIYHTVLPDLGSGSDMDMDMLCDYVIPMNNVITNLRCIIKSNDIISMYNKLLETNEFDIKVIKEILSAYYHLIMVIRPTSRKIPILLNLIMQLNAMPTITSKAYVLYVLYFLSNINIDTKKSSEQDILDALYN